MKKMERHANQYKVTISKEKVYQNDKTKPYYLMYTSTLEAAAKQLKGNEFKLYVYLASNMNGFEMAFSPHDVNERYNMSEDTARNAFRTLKEKGFIVTTAKHDCTFYDVSQNPRYIFEEEKRVDNDGVVLTYREFYEEVKDYAPSKEAIDDMWNTFKVVEED